jgi:hypothetical protein
MKAKHANATLETHAHIRSVQGFINQFVKELIDRAAKHDVSKLESPELEVFGEHTAELAEVEYGSEEYDELLEKVKPAIEHHYSKNRHHPEHWPFGIDDMTLIDVLEMLADWKAATSRNKDGNIRKSIEINAERFDICPQLVKILENTVREYFPD